MKIVMPTNQTGAEDECRQDESEHRSAGRIEADSEWTRNILSATDPSCILRFLSDANSQTVRKTAKHKIASLVLRQKVADRERFFSHLLTILNIENGSDQTWYRRNMIELIISYSYNACLLYSVRKYIESAETSHFISLHPAMQSHMEKITDTKLSRLKRLCQIEKDICSEKKCLSRDDFPF